MNKMDLELLKDYNKLIGTNCDGIKLNRESIIHLQKNLLKLNKRFLEIFDKLTDIAKGD